MPDKSHTPPRKSGSSPTSTRKRSKTLKREWPWRAVTGFGWPADLEVRVAIRRGEKPGDRGEMTEYAKGETVKDVPDDVWTTLREQGLVEQFDPDTVDERDPAGLPEEGSTNGDD